MQERRLDFERLDSRDLCAIVGVPAEGEQVAEDRWVVPVTIDDSTGVRAAEVRMRYDANAWEVNPSSIKTGSAWVNGGATLAKVDPEAGEITVFVFATEELPGDAGNLLDVELSPQQPLTTMAAASPAIEVESVRLNEGQIAAAVDGFQLEDYVNPRVREKHNLVMPKRLVDSRSATNARIGTPENESTSAATWLTLLESRNRNHPMGPQELEFHLPAIAADEAADITESTELTEASELADADLEPETDFDAEADSEVDSPAWLLLLTDHEARKRAA